MYSNIAVRSKETELIISSDTKESREYSKAEAAPLRRRHENVKITQSSIVTRAADQDTSEHKIEELHADFEQLKNERKLKAKNTAGRPEVYINQVIHEGVRSHAPSDISYSYPGITQELSNKGIHAGEAQGRQPYEAKQPSGSRQEWAHSQTVSSRLHPHPDQDGHLKSPVPRSGLRHADNIETEPALNPKFNVTQVNLSVHPQGTDSHLRADRHSENENSLRANTGTKSKSQLMRHEIQNLYLSKSREYPNIDQIINPNKTQEVSLHQSSFDNSSHPEHSMNYALQMAALSKPHGLLTYNETEKNKQASLFMPRSLLTKKLKH